MSSERQVGGISMDEPQENPSETLREGMTAAAITQGKKSWRTPRLMRLGAEDAQNSTPGTIPDGGFLGTAS
jgi:hypothetical protein